MLIIYLYGVHFQLLLFCSWNILEPTIIKNLIFSKIQSDSLNEISKDELNLIFQKLKLTILEILAAN